MASRAIHRVRNAIAELQANGTKATTKSIGNYLGISKQRVHQILKESDELSRLDSFQQRDELERISKELKNFDTKGLSLSEIKKLPINGIASLNAYKMSTLLSRYKIPHARNILDKIKSINNAEQYTAHELHKIVGGSFRVLTQVLYAEKISFKGGRRNEQPRNRPVGRTPIKPSRRNRKSLMQSYLEKISEIDTQNHTISSLAKMIGTNHSTLSKIVAKHNIPVHKERRSKDEMAPIWGKLRSLDTEKYTTKELLALLDNKVRINVMMKYLAKNGMKYKSMKYKRERKEGIHSKLIAIDTSQHTVRELHSMIGGDIRNLQNQLAKNKIPYKKLKTGPKKGRDSKLISKLVAIDTSQHTATELHKMVGGDLKNLRNHLAKNKIPYKRVIKN